MNKNNTQESLFQLSVSQQSIWHHQRLNPNATPYNVGQVLHIKGPLDLVAFNHAHNLMLEKTQALRLRFSVVDDIPYQTVTPFRYQEIPFFDFRSSQNIASDVELFLSSTEHTPFNLEQDACYRFGLIQTAEEEWSFFMIWHHIVIDAVGVGILIKMVERAYNNQVDSTEINSISWKESVVEYQDYANSSAWDSDKKFWADKLKGLGPPASLCPLPLSPVELSVPGSVSILLTREEYNKTLHWATSNGGSALSAFITVMLVYLSTILGERDLCVGTLFSGRHKGSRHLIGMLANHLALRTQLTPTDTIYDINRSVASELRSALRHRKYPFGEITSSRRQSALEAPFATIVNYLPGDRTPQFGESNGDIEIRGWGPVADCELRIVEKSDGQRVEIRFDYNIERYSKVEARAHLARIIELIKTLPSLADTPLATVDILQPQERQSLIAQSAGPVMALEPNLLTLPALFEAQVAKTPEATALIFEDQHLSYQQLDQAANRLARHLIAQGIGPDQIVAILLDRSPKMIISMLAVLKAGGAYLPLDPEYPAERLSCMLTDSGARVLLSTAPQLKELMSDARTDTLQVIDISAPAVQAQLSALSPNSVTDFERSNPLDSQHLAYLIYTSGSTGTPKGAGNRHDSISNRLQWMQQILKLDSTDRVIQKTACGFDVAVWEWFLPLMAGARLIIAHQGGQRDPNYLRQTIDQQQVTVLHFVPSMLDVFVQNLSPSACPSLKQIVTSGEALSGALQFRTLRAFKDLQLWNLYGPTEAAIDVSYWLCQLDDHYQTPPIGVPIWNTALYVLDHRLEAVPNGVVGELYIAGEGLARGYLGRTGLTAERFIANPFEPGARMYRTGDLARRREDGNIEYIGRADSQVKIRGYRIELGEIESALLLGSDALAQVAVIARAHSDGDTSQDTRLIAYLVPRELGILPNDAELRTQLARTLPNYMVPAAFVELEQLPLTPNGKLDHRALPDPDFSADANTYRAPVTDNEILLCSLFSEVTGAARVGLDDSFFAIGGHSLLAMRLIARVRQATELELPLRTLFESPTPGALAAQLDSTQIEAGVPLTPGMGHLADQHVVLSYGQIRLWSLDQLQGASAAYNIPQALRLHGKLDTQALAQSLSLLIARHESLRTVIRVNEDGEPFGLLLPAPEPKVQLSQFYLQTSDLQLLDPNAQEGALAQNILKEAGRPFDLGQDYSLRARIIRLSETECVLLLTQHHQASDGESAGVFIRELSEAYNRLLNQQLPEWSPLAIQYSDWAAWQQQTLETGIEEKIERARTRLAQAPDSLSLPLDHPRDANRARRAAYLPIKLSTELTQALSTLAAKEGTTLFALLLGAYGATLARLANQDTVVIGSPVTGRNRIETEDLVGFLSNTLALPITIDDGCSGLELIAQAKTNVEAALIDQDLPFERLVDGLGVVRSLSQTPVFQAMFAYQNEAQETLNFEGLSALVEPVFLPTTKCDLTFYTTLNAQAAIEGSIEYDADLFDKSSVQSWAQAFQCLVQGLVQDPEQLVMALPLMDSDVRVQLIAESEGLVMTLEQDLLTLPALFEVQVSKTPEATALIFEDQQLSYQQLDRAANRLARHLIAQGVGPDQIVAILLDRSPEMIISMLAVLKAGGAYLPLDPEYPSERLSFMLTDSGAQVLLSTATQFHDLITNNFKDAFQVIDITAPAVQAQLSVLSLNALTDLERSSPLNPQNLAYLIYTSGSTGKPKGTAISSRALQTFINAMTQEVALEPSDVLLALTTVGFDIAGLEIYLPLIKGATIVLASIDEQKEPQAIANLIHQHQVTIVQATPSLWNVLMSQVTLPSLRMLVGGEALPRKLAAQMLLIGPVTNLYGPTEATIWASTYSLSLNDTDTQLSASAAPIGKPLPDYSLLILDSTLEPVTNGVVGELYIAGRGLARGYLGRTGLTAERFIANPFEPGVRIYRTGDLVRRRADGNIEFIGRSDAQVKIRGYRIELGEIESALLLGSDALAQVAVIARAHSDGDTSQDTRLIAYLVPRELGILPNDAELRTQLARTLPNYMVPAAFVELEQLPLTPNGKLDHRALPDPDFSADANTYRAPVTDNEILLCSLFAEVTGATRVGLDDSFFAIGGHSLLAIRLIACVRQATELELPLRTLFELPTPGALAAQLDSTKIEAGVPLIPGTGHLADSHVVLSYGQIRLLTLDLVDGASATYNMAVAVYLEGQLDTQALRQSLVALISRHQPLHTVTSEDNDGNPVGRLVDIPSSDEVLSTIDLSADFAADPTQTQATLQAMIESQVAVPFDLQHDIPLRGQLTITSKDSAILLLTLHHHAGDAVSTNIIATELEQAYLSYRSGNAPDWTPLAVQYSDWALWQQLTLESNITCKLERARLRLVNMPELLTLPVDHPRTAQRNRRAGYLAVSISAVIVQQLEQLARDQGTTLFTVVLTAYAATLSRIAGQNDVVIGVPVTGRNHTELEKMVGFLLNTLAIPISMDGGCTGVSLIERTRKSVEATLNDQDLPFERLVDSLNLNRSLINTPVFQAMFAFQSDATPTFSFQGIACESKIINSSTTKFDLTLHLNKELDGTLQGDFEFDQSIFETSSVAHWLDAFYTLTAALCQDPAQLIVLLPIISQTEKTKLIADSAGETVTIDPEFLVFTQAFETQVRRTPDATAVVSNLDVMTYSELDKASNQMARHILEQGLKTDQILGILIDRSLEMVVSIIATIKAGGAYLPLDANYPTARLSYMLIDSQAVALICSHNRLEALNFDSTDLSLPPFWVLDDADIARSIASKSTSRLAQSELSTPVNADNLVYVMYTSGSTGKPKGVSFLHGALGNLVKWKATILPSEAPRVLQYSPVGFDASAQEIASALCNGSPLVLIDEQSRRDSRELLEHMHTQKVEHLYAPFVVLSSLAEARNSFDDQGWPDEVFTAGEQLQITPEIRSAFTAHPRSRLHNFYGPTEAHVVSNYSMPDNPASWTEFPPIGTPIFNTQLYVLDPVLNVMPDGMEGELYIAGRGLARGYLDKPGMTAEKFIACPFSHPGARMYRTGDLARRRNGQIEYLGRVDEQVKLNGYRIEMGEIEAALLLYFDCFAQVAVIAREVNGIKSLVTYFVVYAGKTVREHSELHNILAVHLPEYMVPSYFVAVDTLPLTPNGKLDRLALPVPEGRNTEQAYREPSTGNEILLCQLFSEITGTELVSVDDSFFAIGGHSLLAMRLIAQLRSRSGIILPLRTLFEFTTPESLALNLETLDEEDEPMLIQGGGRISQEMPESGD